MSRRDSKTSLAESAELLPTSSEGSPVSSKKTSSVDAEGQVAIHEEERPTDWYAVATVSGISLVTFFVLYACNTNAFIYLNKLSEGATVADQGWVKFLTRLAHGFSTAFFALITYRTKKFRRTVQCGNALLVVSCALYFFIEAFPMEWRLPDWLLIFSLQAAAEGANTVLNSYIPRVSSKADRMKAYSFLAGAEVIAIAAGPVVQIACNQLESNDRLFPSLPGTEWLRVSQFTILVWICCFFSVVNVVVITVWMKDPPKEEHERTFTETRKQAWQELKRTDHRLLAVCIVEKCVASFGCTTILTLAPPFIVATFGQDTNGQSFYTTLFQVTSGGCALVTAACFAFVKQLNRLNSSRVFLVSLVCFSIAYWFSIPAFDFYSRPVPVYNATTNTGCNPSEYAWCEDSMMVEKHVWIAGTGAVLGFGFVLANIAHDTLYSQILGGIDQNVMTGLLIGVVDMSMALVPLVATYVFKHNGPNTWWTIVVITMLSGLVLWLCTMGRMDAYKKVVNERDEKREAEERKQRESTADEMTSKMRAFEEEERIAGRAMQ